MKKEEWIVLVISVSMPVLMLVPGIMRIPFIPGSEYSDFLITHYPNVVQIQQSLRMFQTIPLWSDLILSGYPFYADPLSSLFYPPMWLVWILPLPFGINLVVLIHILLGGIGMYILMRMSGNSFIAGIVSMITFTMLPKVYAHLGAGHITLVMATSLIPWVLVGVYLLKERSGRPIALSGMALGLIFLADPRVFPFAAILFAGLSFTAHNQLYKQVLINVGNQLIISIMIAAPLLLPLLRYSALSSRSILSTSEQAIFSLPTERLLGMIFPDLGGNPELLMYFGAFGLVALVLSFLIRPLNRTIVYWWGIFFFSIFYGLGSNFPLFPLVAKIPGFDHLRVPTRIIFFGGLAIAILSGNVVDKMYELSKNRFSRLLLTALWIFVTLLSAGLFIAIGDSSLEVIVGWLSLTVVLLVMFFWRNIRWCGWVLIIIIIINLGYVNLSMIEFRPLSDINSELTDLEVLKEKLRNTRVYSPSDSLPQNYAADHQVELVNGINPLQLAKYADYMEGATGVPSDGYSVSIPPFISGNPQNDNRLFVPDPDLLGRLGVRYIISDYPLSMEQTNQLLNFRDLFIYENLRTRPMAWLQRSEEKIDQEYQKVELVSRRTNEISIIAKGPNQLVIAENYYPGWVCNIDGSTSEIKPIDIFISLKLEPGQHIVICKFAPIDYLIGLMIAFLGLVICIKQFLWK